MDRPSSPAQPTARSTAQSPAQPPAESLVPEMAKVHVVYVHGTWARGFWKPTPANPDKPRWFERGSEFDLRMNASLLGAHMDPVRHDPVLWSGDNSLFERSKASRELLTRLKTIPSDAPCLIVAHSYGGNAVLRALDEVDDERIKRIRLITLATPFVHLFVPHLDRDNMERKLLAMLLYTMAIAIVTARWMWPQLSLPLLLVVGVPLGLAGLWLHLVMVPREKAMIVAQAPCLATRLSKAAGFDKFRTRPPRTLILRGVEDEAALFITMAGALGRSAQILRDVILEAWHRRWTAAKVAGAILVGAVLWIVVYRLMYGPIEPSPESIDTFLWWLRFAQYVIVGVPLAMLTIAVLTRSLAGIAAGRELGWIPHLEVSVATSPDWHPKTPDEASLVWTKTVPRRGSTAAHIRHSVYDDENLFLLFIQPWISFAFAKEKQEYLDRI